MRHSRGCLRNMRLAEEEQLLIKRIITNAFGDDASIWLFGSRVDDSKRGGDVDLFVVPAQNESLFEKRITCLGRLEAALPYPVDLIVNEPGRDLPVYRIAQTQGVRL